MASSEIFQASTRKREAPFRGKFKSRDYNSFQDEIIRDHANIAKSFNNLSARMNKRFLQLEGELRHLQASVDGNRSKRLRENLRLAIAGSDLTYDQDFSDLSDLTYDTGGFAVSEANRVRVEPIYGQATVPFDRVVSRLYSFNPQTQELFVPGALTVTVTPIEEGSGATITTDTPSLSTDGRIGEGFLREVALDPASDLEGVTMDVVINVPNTYASQANFFTLFPNPAGQVDVLAIKYSTSGTATYASADLPNFTPVNSASSVRVHFAPLAITSILVRLRQRNWVIEDNLKTFMYGLKEVHLDLVELDKLPEQGTFTDSNIAIWKLDTPDIGTYEFKTLEAFKSLPDHEAVAGVGIDFRIYSDDSLSTLLWDGLSGSFPVAVPAEVTSIYIVTALEYDTVGFKSPVLENFYLTYSVGV